MGRPLAVRDDALFRRLWEDRRETYTSIAERLGISYATVDRTRHRLGLPARGAARRGPRRRTISDAELRAAWAEGVPIRELAERAGVSVSGISVACNRLGLPSRRGRRHGGAAPTRFACRVCGQRSAAPVHPACEAAA